MYLMRNHDVWIYVRCANSDPRIAFDRLYDLIDEAAGHGFLVRGTSFDHCSGNTLKDRIDASLLYGSEHGEQGRTPKFSAVLLLHAGVDDDVTAPVCLAHNIGKLFFQCGQVRCGAAGERPNSVFFHGRTS